MDDLARVEGKTIKSIERDNNGENSYLIIKFKEGGKINVVSNSNGSGIGQLDVVSSGIKMEDISGKRIQNIIEEFDGENDYLILNLIGGGKISINSFGSSEESNATLSVNVYTNPEKISENKIITNNMEKIVAESLRESLYGQNINQKDYAMGDMPGSDYNIDDEDIDDNAEEPIESNNELIQMLSNELSIPEFNRGILDFTIKSTGEEVSGTPLVKMGEGKYFLFKTKSGMKKVSINDIKID